MPQALLLLIAGVGIVAGARWASKQFDRMAAETRRAAEEMQRRAEEASRPDGARDLGALVFDPATGQYRPKG